ncbi:MAG TPA: glycerophosphodiester phosphodiesterase family protein [Devosiaceae bacterium]|nr:glycerophosphodiester phosphodiesterase family protein [Devosiaceae bacterium]
MISIIAHRGFSSAHRENSPAAWRAAVEAAADFIEVDVRFTADWQCVCLHDADLLRLAGRPERIAGLPYEEIEGIEAGGQSLAPRLIEALETIPASTGIMLDVKDERPEALAILHDIIGRAEARRIVWGLHAEASVAAVKALGHQALLGLTPQPEQGTAFIDAGCSLLRLWESEVTAQRLAAAGELGVPVWITAGGRGTDQKTGDIDAKNLGALAELGISGVLVNDPALARADLHQLNVLKDSTP